MAGDPGKAGGADTRVYASWRNEEAEAQSADQTRKSGQFKYIAKIIENWPIAVKDSPSFKIRQQEAEELKTAVVSEQPRDRQLLGAKEDVNTARRRVMKAEGKQDKATKDLTVAKDEVAAAHSAHDTAEAQLETLQKALKTLVIPKEEPKLTKEEVDLLKRIR